MNGNIRIILADASCDSDEMWPVLLSSNIKVNIKVNRILPEFRKSGVFRSLGVCQSTLALERLEIS